MERRVFLGAMGASAVTAWLPRAALAGAPGRYENLLILVELKGGNDGLNTVVPYADADYYSLRPRIAIGRDQVLQLDSRAGLHPSLQLLMPLWQKGELAVVQSLGYPSANLSHFRFVPVSTVAPTGPVTAPPDEIIETEAFDMLNAELVEFARCIEQKRPYPVDIDQVLHGMAVFDAVVRSGLSGKIEKVE